MLNRKLLEIIQRLEGSEIKKLRLFLQSPYFTYGMSKEVLQLFDLIVQNGADGQAQALDKKHLNTLLFPSKPYQENKKNSIDTLASSLFGLTKKFLFIQSTEEHTSKAMQEMPLARFYTKFGMEERFLTLEQHIRTLLGEQLDGESLYLDHYHLEELVAQFKAIYSVPEIHATHAAQKDALDQFYFVARLEILCHMAQLRQTDEFHLFDFPELEAQIIDLIKKMVPQKNTVATMYLMVLDIYDHLTDFIFVKRYETQLDLLSHQIAPVHRNNCMALLRIFYMKRFQRTDKEEHLREYFNLITTHLEAGYLYYEGRLLSAALMNITRNGLRLGAYEQVLQILKSHPPERIGGTLHPIEVYHMNLSFFYFAKKDYERAEQYLTYCNFYNIHYSIQTEIIRIKIFYETDSPLVEARTRALLQKVRRAKMSLQYREKYYQLLGQILLLIKYRWDKKSPKKAQLAESVRNTPGLLEKEWLMSHLP
jgi:hypothetical protein